MPKEYAYPVKDVHITNHTYSTWYIHQAGRGSHLWLGCWDWPDKPYSNFYAHQSRILMQFQPPTMGAEDTLISAKLKVPLMYQKGLKSPYNPTTTDATHFTIDVHKITQPWDEGTGTGQLEGYQHTGATWSNRLGNGYGWNTYGGSYNYNPVASSTQHRDAFLWEFDITSLAREWIANPTSNSGIMLKYRNEAPNGSHYTWAREAANFGAYIEFDYNSPPEKPRGMAPNFGGFICADLAHTMEFKWSFIDTAAPIARGKSDIVFVVDVSGSMSWQWSRIRTQLSRYIDRLNTEQVDWQIGIVAYSDVRIGESLYKYGWFTDKSSVLAAFDRMPRLNGGDYPESGLEALLDTYSGAKSFSWRSQSKGQIMICTDAPFHNRSGVDTYYPNYSIYELSDAVNWMQSMNITCSVATNTHCGSYTQLRIFPTSTGGQYIEETSNWGDYFTIKSIHSANEAERYDEGDYQTRADFRIFQINNDNSRTQIWAYTMYGSNESLFVKPLISTSRWSEDGAYEWDVRVYDKYSVVSPWSDRAPFSYILDVNAAIGVPMFREPLTVGATINRKALDEIKSKLYYEVRKYSNLDPGITETLFTSDIVPAKSDFVKILDLINGMLISDGLLPISEDLIEDAFGVSDLTKIRNAMTSAAMSPPDNPVGGRAKRSNGVRRAPISIRASHANHKDYSINLEWTEAEATTPGWDVTLQPVMDTDINYYKMYREEIMNLKNKKLRILNEVYLTTEQVQGGNIYIPDTGRVDGQTMYYRPHDMNGRTSPNQGNITLDYTPAASTVAPIANYTVQYQQRHWNATTADPKGVWYNAYIGSSKTFTHNVGAEGSYWYRVRATSTNGVNTGWTYSQNIVYVRN